MGRNKLRRYEIEDLLRLVGLQRRRSFFRIVLAAAGLSAALAVTVGAGAGVVMGPRLRQGLGSRIDRIRERMKNDRGRAAVNAAPQA